jgi:tripeptidyl-peptidase-1
LYVANPTPLFQRTHGLTIPSFYSVTAIGGTENIAPEVAVSRFPSGGGFSDYFPQPLYQLVDAQKYVAALPKGTYKNLYNPFGRAFPDVSTQGDRYRIWLRGIARSIGGTSASSPAFAGLIALLNDARAAKGKKSLGFLNPLIYSAKTRGVWNDVTVGKNPGCGTQGFNATKGWDPVTGLGTPNFGKLFDIVV